MNPNPEFKAILEDKYHIKAGINTTIADLYNKVNSIYYRWTIYLGQSK